MLIKLKKLILINKFFLVSLLSLIMEIINIICRDDKKICLPKRELVTLSNQEWFLSVLAESEYIEKKDENYIIYEDYNTVLSIIESLRYNSLICLEGVSLDLLLRLCEKWCCPEWLCDAVNEKIERNEKHKLEYLKSNPIYQYLYHEKIFTCHGCRVGFKLSENKKDSCKKHKYSMDAIASRFSCCGETEKGTHCLVGYHIPNESPKEYEKEIDFIRKMIMEKVNISE